MQLIALCFVGVWLYSVWSLVYIPIKIVGMKRRSQDVWTFLSRSRLLLSALAYLASAPFLGLLAMAISSGGVGGSHASGVPNSVETAAWVVCWVFVAAAVVALFLAFTRQRPTARHEPAP
jgi:cation transporter-like permease